MKKLIFALLFLLFGCDQQTSLKGEAQSALVVVSPWEVNSLDPSKSGYLFQRLQLAETLVEVNPQGELIPALALDWQHNEDASIWVFNLRPEVKFHNLQPLTAEDVVRSLQVALTKPTALKTANIKEITALNPLQVQITLQQGLISFPAYLAHSTALILAQQSFDTQQNVIELIGTGPYQASKIEPPQRIEQRTFEYYWGEGAKIKQVSYLANSRSETRALLAQSQENYLVFNLDSASLQRLQQDKQLTVQTQPIARTIQYKVNAALPLFADPKVRQILSDAIDRAGIAEYVLGLKNAQAQQIFPKSFADWRLAESDLPPETTPNYPLLTQKLLALGFSQDQNGKLTLAGKPVHFRLRTFSDRPELPLVATALQDQWRKLGIEVEVLIGNFAEIPAAHQNGSLEMALYARNYGLIPDPMGTLLSDFAPQGGDWGVMNWHDSALTAALAQLQQPLSPEKQQPLKQTIAQIIYQQRPITPILFYQQNAVAHKNLTGLQLDPFERNFYLNQLSWQP